MEVSAVLQPVSLSHSIDPLTEKIKQRLIKKGVLPSPKIIHTLRKKELQKSIRKSKRLASQSPHESLTSSQKKSLSEEFYFQNICREYKTFMNALDSSPEGSNSVGNPWEPLEKGKMRELARGYEGKEANVGGKLKYESLKELGLILKERNGEIFSSFLDDDDVILEEDMLMSERERTSGSLTRRRVSEAEAIRILVDRLSAREITAKDWKFSRMMKQSGLPFTETQMLRIVGKLGDQGCWKQATEVVEWVYTKKEHIHYKSRFVYTKLLAVIGKARRPEEALRIFKQMRGDCHTYPDAAAYHSIAVTLGQAGMVRELMRVIECMEKQPPKTIKNMYRKNWDPSLQPDIIVFNSVLNACVASRQWKGVSWVFEQLRKGGLRANSATYGLAMEVMLNSGKYDLVHKLFLKMKKNGQSPKSLTYKVLVQTFWKEDKVDEAIRIVREMEQKGVIGSASVYYELACCLCNKGRWKEAMMEVEKLKKVAHSKPLTVTFTGMIKSSMDGGNLDDCISIFKYMQNHCAPDIGTVNVMLKVYGRVDMFSEAKELFENVQRSIIDKTCLDDYPTLIPDVYTFGSMLEASARAHQWEYFEYVYKEMCISGFQLDQGKYAVLLVEASRAGKWHLLEHAFDTILEAGEIPDPVMFSEMVYQATIRGDYEKACAIVGALVHVPFQLNMKDWTYLFEKNEDVSNKEHLKKLYNILHDHETPERSSASELLKALHYICGFVPFESRFDDSLSTSSNINGATIVDTTGHNIWQDNNFGGVIIPQSSSNEDEDDHVVLSSKYDTDEDDATNSAGTLLGSVNDNPSADLLDEYLQAHIQGSFDNEQESDDDDFDVDECHEPESPSAHEILESWKQSRING